MERNKRGKTEGEKKERSSVREEATKRLAADLLRSFVGWNRIFQKVLVFNKPKILMFLLTVALFSVMFFSCRK